MQNEDRIEGASGMAKKDNCTEKPFDTHSEVPIGGKIHLVEQNMQACKRALRLGDTTINIKSIFTGKTTLDKALGNIVKQRMKPKQ